MRNRKPKIKVKVATGQHRQTLLAVMYLAGVLLLINAWLITQHNPVFGN